MATPPPSVKIETVREDVDAQTAPAREPDAAKVQVHEVKVSTDVVITDPNDPLAVQVPEEGNGFLDLPVHGLDGPSPEQQFADSESKSKSTRPAKKEEKASG